MEKEKIEKDKYELVQVPTGSALAIQKPNGEVISQEQAVVEILNLVKDIAKAIK
jgi:hypothetical protein